MATHIEISDTAPTSFYIGESQEIEFSGMVSQETCSLIQTLSAEDEITLPQNSPALTYPPGKQGSISIQGANLPISLTQPIGLNVLVTLVDEP